MEDKVYNFIRNNCLIKAGERVGVAVSGGSDSMALLSMLKSLKEKLNIELFVLHINHSIRGEESDRDEQFVQDFCKENGLPFYCKRVDALGYTQENKLSLEQGARILRYHAFAKFKQELNLDVICLAHHKEDQAETLLMHIGRGSGLKGLVGMEYKNSYFARPLLCLNKQEIMDFLKSNLIAYVDDSTNQDDEYSRNFVRHNLIPAYKEKYSGVVDNLCSLSAMAKETNEFIQSLIPRDDIEVRGNEVLLKKSAYENHIVLLKAEIRKCFELIGKIVDVEQKHIDIIYSLIDLAVGKRVDMPNGAVVTKVYDGLLFSCERKQFDQEIAYNEKSCQFGDCFIEIEKVKPTEVVFEPKKLYLDADKVPCGAVWRIAQTGDVFKAFGGGTKKIKDYFVSKKIDSVARKNLPCLFYGNECLAILGVQISDKVKIESTTKNVVIIWKG